jgi:hypothetical protein
MLLQENTQRKVSTDYNGSADLPKYRASEEVLKSAKSSESVDEAFCLRSLSSHSRRGFSPAIHTSQ